MMLSFHHFMFVGDMQMEHFLKDTAPTVQGFFVGYSHLWEGKGGKGGGGGLLLGIS